MGRLRETRSVRTVFRADSQKGRLAHAVGVAHGDRVRKQMLSPHGRPHAKLGCGQDTACIGRRRRDFALALAGLLRLDESDERMPGKVIPAPIRINKRSRERPTLAAESRFDIFGKEENE